MQAMGQGNVAPEPQWPYAASLAEVAGALGRLSLDAEGLSPLRGRLPTSIESTAHPDDAVGLLGLALLTVADPVRILLLVGQGTEGRLIASFVANGATVVGYELDGDTLTISPPMLLPTFAQEISRLLGASDRDERKPDLFARRLLATLSGLLALGWCDGRPVPIRTDEALAVIAEFLPDGRSATEALAALDSDGVLSARDATVMLDPSWLEPYAYLIDPVRTDLISIELRDAEASVWAPRTLSIVGAGAARRLTLTTPFDDSLGLDGYVRLFPLDRARVQAAVSSLTSPPWGPPASPRANAGAAIDLAATLRGEAEAPDLGPELGDWSVGGPLELARAAQEQGAGGAAAAVLRPAATIQLCHRRNGTRHPRQRTIAISPDSSAAEWELEGSRVRWRALPLGAVGRRVAELLPAGASAHADSVFDLQVRDVAVMMGRPGATGDPVDLPAELQAVSADPETHWCSIRGLTSKHGAVSGVSLLFATSTYAGTWRFEGSHDRVQVIRASSDDLRRALFEALTS
jgi:hypothetical protein